MTRTHQNSHTFSRWAGQGVNGIHTLAPWVLLDCVTEHGARRANGLRGQRNRGEPRFKRAVPAASFSLLRTCLFTAVDRAANKPSLRRHSRLEASF